MTGVLEVLFNAYGVHVKSIRQLKGGAKLLELFEIPYVNSPQENFRRLEARLRSFFPQSESLVCIEKCARGHRFDLTYVAALSIGALIAQDISSASSNANQCLPERIRNLCAYDGPQVSSIKEFCEVVFKHDNVPVELRGLVTNWLENSENEISFSSSSSMNSSINSISGRAPLSPLNAMMRTPENRIRIREKYNQEVIKLRGDLLMMRERYDQLEADMKEQAAIKDKELGELQNRVKILREMIDAESKEIQTSENPAQNEVSQAKIRMLQKQVQQLQNYEQKFFDEKFRAEELETKLVQDEKRIKDLKAKITALEVAIAERDDELYRAADQIANLRDKIEEERVQTSFVKHRNLTQDKTLDSTQSGGENLGEAVQDILSAELKSTNEDLQHELQATQDDLQAKTVELAELQLSNQMQHEQVVDLEAQVDTLRGQIRNHLETITQAAEQANELSLKLQSAQAECEQLRIQLSAVTTIKEKLEERRTYLENKVQLLKTQIEEARSRFIEMNRIKGLVEEQLKGQSTTINDLRTQLTEKTNRIASVESELSRATTSFTESLQSLNTQLNSDRANHFEEKSKLEQKIQLLETQMSESALQSRTLYSELEKLKIERAEFHTQLNIQVENEVKMKNEMSNLEKKLKLEEEQKKTFETSFKQAMSEMEQLKISHESLKLENESRKASEATLKERLDSNEVALTEAQTKLMSVEEDHQKLKKNYISTCAQMDHTNDKHEFSLKEIHELKKSVAELGSKLQQKTDELEAMASETSELRDSLNSEQSDKQFMQEALNEASSTIARNEKEIQDLLNQRAEVLSKLEQVEAELTEKIQSVNELGNQKTETDSELKLERTQVTLLKKQIEELTETAEKSKSALIEAQSHVESLQNELTEAQSTLVNANKEADDSQLTIAALAQQKIELETQIGELQEESEQSKQQLAQYVQSESETKQRVGMMEEEIERLQQEKSTAIEQWRLQKENLRKQLDQLNERNTDLEKQLADELERISELNVQVQVLETDMKNEIESHKECQQQLVESQKTLTEAMAEVDQLRKDQDANLDQIKEFMEELHAASVEKDKVTEEMHVLKSEYETTLREMKEKLNNSSSIDSEKLKSFKKSLIDKLEMLDIQAPVMSDEELLAILDKSVEQSKQIKDLQMENKSLLRLAENAEAEVKCRILELNSENDKLKRNIRELSSTLERNEKEMHEITTAVLKAKNGDAVDGAVLSTVAREIINLAVAVQENTTTKEEITQLRLAVQEQQLHKEKVQVENESLKQVIQELENQNLAQKLNQQSTAESSHDQTLEIMREGHDIELDRVKSEHQRCQKELADCKVELFRTQQYVSTLLEKYDKSKENNERRISGLYEYIQQKNIPLPKPRRKSPNQPGLPIVSRQSEFSADWDLKNKYKEKDDEIRRLKLAKRELEKKLCMFTTSQQLEMNTSTTLSRDSLAPDNERKMMPPPSLSYNNVRDRYPAADDRVWNAYRDPHYDFSLSNCSDFDSSSVKSMPAFVSDRVPMQRSFSTRSLLFDHNVPNSRPSERMSSNYLSRGVSAGNFVPPDDFPSPPAMFSKPLPAHSEPRLSNAFESINELNYKCDLNASLNSNRGGGRSVGIGGLGLGDDEEAQFMNPKNLEDLKNGGPPSPNDPKRGSVLLERNSLLPPHLKSSYPVETQNGKIPVTPLLRRKK